MPDTMTYITRTFADAAELPAEQQLEFLAKIAKSPFFKPDSNADMFRDTAAFCLTVYREQTCKLADTLKIPRSLLREWTEGRHLPAPASRNTYAHNMIETALYSHGWVGHPPRPPVMDGSNIVPLFKERAP